MAEQAVWIVQGGGSEPLTVTALRERLEAGTLLPDAQVQHVRLPTWIPIVAVKGLADVVQRQRAERASARPQAQAAPGAESSWMIAVDGKQDGPMTRAEIARRARRGMIHGDTLVWREGMRGWIRLDEVPDLTGVLPPPESITETGRMRVLTREEAKARLEKATPKTLGECRRFLERNPEHEPTLQVLETFVRTGKDAAEAVALLESTLGPRGEWQRLMASWRNLLRSVQDTEARTDLRVRMGQAAEGPLESPKQAFALFATALRESPRRTDVQDALLRLGDRIEEPEALADLLEEQIAGHGGTDRAALLILGARHDLERRQDAARAATRLTEAARLDPGPAVIGLLEQLGERTGDWWPWADGLRAAADRAEGDAKVAHLHQLANALQVRLDRPVRAVTVYGELLGVAPDDLQTRDALKRLHKRGVAPEAVYPLLEKLWRAEQDWVALRDLQIAHLPHLAPGDERADAHHALAVLCRDQLGDVGAALNWLRQAVRQAPAALTHREALLTLAAAQGALPAAAETLEQLVGEHPSLEVELAWALFDLHGRRRGDAAAAEPWGRRAVEGAEATALAGQLEALADFPALAVSALERLIAATPAGAERVALRLRLARTHRDQKTFDAAIQAYEAALREEPEHEAALDELAALHAAAERWDAWLAVRNARADAAGQEAERLEIWRETARTLARLGRSADATELWHRVLAAAPDDAEALDGLEALSAAAQDWAGLADVLERRRARAEGEPALAVTRRLAGVYEQRLGDAPRAAACYRALVRAEPEDESARRGLARTAEGAEALAAWLYLFEGNPADAETADALANLHARDGAYGAHVSVRLQHLATVADDDAAVPALRALATLARERALDEGAAVLRALLARRPDDAEASAELVRHFADKEDWQALSVTLQQRLADAQGPLRFQLRRELAALQSSRLNRPDEAFDTLCAAFSEAPTDALSDELARLAALTDGWQRLAELYRRAVTTVAPEHQADLYRRLAGWYAGPLDDAQHAVDACAEVLTRVPGDAPTVATLEALFAGGRERQRIVALLDPVLSAADRWADLAELLADTLPASGPTRVAGLLRLADIYEHRLSRQRAALDALALGLEAAPGNAEMLANLQRLAVAEDRLDLAADAMTRALFLAEKPKDIVALGAALAPSLAALGQRARALRVYTRILDADPRHGEALEALDAAAVEQGDLEGLAQLLRRRIAAAPDGEAQRVLRRRLAENSAARGRPDEAVVTWMAAVERDPNDLEALQALDALHTAAEEWDALAEVRRRRLALTQGADRLPLLEAMAELADRRGALEEALGLREQALVEGGDSPERLERLETQLRLEGRWARLEQLAEQRLPQVAESPEQEIRLLSLMAEAQTELGRPRDALESWLQVLERDPANEPALRAARALYAERDQPAGLARMDLDLAGVLGDEDPEKALLLREAARALDGLGRAAEAAATWQHLRALQPEDEEARVALEGLYTAAGDWLALRGLLQKVLARTHDSDTRLGLHLRIAELSAERLDDLAGARTAYEAALTESPGSPRATVALGALYRKQADWSAWVQLALARLGDVQDLEARRAIYLEAAEVLEEKLKSPAHALALLGRALLESPDDGLGDRLGGLAEKLGRWPEVVQACTAALKEAAPKAARDLHLRIADWSEHKLNDTQRAVTHYRAMLALNQGDEAALAALHRLFEAGHARAAIAEELARRHEQAGDWQRLHELLTAAVPEAPATARAAAWRRLGALAVEKLGAPHRAFDWYARALVEVPDDDEARSRLLALGEQLGRLDQLAGLFARALPRATRAVRPLGYALAELYERLGDPEGAEEVYTDLLDRLGAAESAALAALEARCTTSGRFIELARRLQAALATDPPEDVRADLATRLARIYEERLNRTAEAIEAWHVVLAVEPQDEEALAGLARLHQAQQDWAPLFEVYGREAQADPSLRAGRYAEMARIAAERLGRPEEAVTLWRQSMVAGGPEAPALAALQTLLGSLGRPAEQVEVINRRLPLVPAAEVVPLLRLKARNLTDLEENSAETRAAWEAVLKAAPEDGEALKALWQLLPPEEATQVADISRRLLLRLPESASDRPAVLRARGRACDQLGDGAGARGAWEALRALVPDDAEAEDRLAVIYADGDIDALVRLQEARIQAAETDQERVERLIVLAEVHDAQRHDGGAAREALARALAVRPEDDILAERILALHLARGRVDAVADLLLRQVDRAGDPATRRAIRLEAAERLAGPLEQPKEALAVVRAGFLADPHDGDYGPRLATLAEVLGDWQTPVGLYLDRLELLDDQGVGGRVRLADWYAERLNDDAAAVPHLQSVLAQEPEHAAAGASLSALLRRQARWGELFTLLSTRASLQLGDEATLRAEAAEIAFAHLDEEAQVAAWRLVLDSDPSHRAALDALAKLYRAREDWAPLVEVLGRKADAAQGDEATALRLAIADVNADHLDDEDGAMAAYKRALALEPHNQTAMAGVERVLTRRAAWDELVRFHEDRLAIAPPAERHAIYARIAEIQAEKQHNAAAALGTERVMRRSATARGRSTQALERVYIESERWEDLATLYERRLKVIPEGAPERSLRTTLATIYADKLGELGKAIEILEPLMDSDADHQEIRETLEMLHVLHERREDWRGSIEVLKRLAKAQRTQDARLHHYVRIGRMYADRLGEPVLATQWWREALEIEPHFKPALEAIDALHAKIKSEYDHQRRIAEIERARVEAEEAARVARVRAEAEAAAQAAQAAHAAQTPVQAGAAAGPLAAVAPATVAVTPPTPKRKRYDDEESTWLLPVVGGAVFALVAALVLWSVWPSNNRRLERTLSGVEEMLVPPPPKAAPATATARTVPTDADPRAPDTGARRDPEPMGDSDEAVVVRRMSEQIDQNLIAIESALLSTGLDYEALLAPGNDSPMVDGPIGGPSMGEPPGQEHGYVAPVAGPLRILSPFGPRGGEMHAGIDILAPEGTPVRAVASGQITFIQTRDAWERRPKTVQEDDGTERTSRAWRAGVYLEIRHEDGRVSRYMHLHDLGPGLVEGMRVQSKQVLGYVGRTAIEHSATHLHFELREPAVADGRYGEAIDPLPILNPGGTGFLPGTAALHARGDVANSPGGPELQEQVREKIRTMGLLEKMDRVTALESLLQQLPLVSPVDDFKVSSGFGRRIEPDTGEPGFHPGLDMPGELQTPIKATAPGTVVYAGWKGIYGRVVELDHGNGIVTRYGHLYSATVQQGQKVAFREKIGEMGNSGRATGEHLHYEIQVDGEVQDPQKFIQAGRFLFKR